MSEVNWDTSVMLFKITGGTSQSHRVVALRHADKNILACFQVNTLSNTLPDPLSQALFKQSQSPG